MLMATALLISGQAKAIICPTIEGKLDVTKVTHSHARKLSAVNGHATKEDGDQAKLEKGETTLYFTTLDEAIAALEDNDTVKITLLTDVSTSTEYNITGGRCVTLDLNGCNLINSNYVDVNDGVGGGTLDIIGQGTISVYTFYMRGSTDPNAENYTVLRIGENVTAIAPNYYYFVTLVGAKADNHCSYGVLVDIWGDVSFGQNGFYINGTVNKSTGNVPVFYIHKTSSCIGINQDDPYNIAYAAGYAKWIIEGECQANTGFYCKAGEFTVRGDAHIEATGETYTEPVVDNNGATGGDGCAFIFDSNKNYAGQIKFNVTGNPTIEASGAGMAIEELRTNSDVPMVDYIVIESGNFIGGEAGCINTTEEVRQKIVNNSTLTGGIYNEDIVNYVDNANKVITYIDTEDGQKWTLGNIPSDKEWQNDFETENSYVQLNNANPTTTIVEGTKNIAYLAVLGQDQVIVKSGARLNVGEVVLGEDAVLVIEPLAMVVVTTKQGIISTNNDQLIIKADAQNQTYGQLLINPDVTFNTQPHATIELTSISYKASATDYLYERFALPTGFAVDSVKGDALTYFERFNASKNQWEGIGYLNYPAGGELQIDKLNEPFTQFHLFTYNSGEKYKFYGKLQGNKDVNLTIKGHSWVGLGNSYAANVSVAEVLAALKEVFQGDANNLALYYYECVNLVLKKYQWTAVTESTVDDKAQLRPMEVFLIKNDGNAVTLPISYRNMVWKQVMGEE